MCLIKTHNEIKLAYEDIPVYKVLTEDNFAPYVKFYRYYPGLNTPTSLTPSRNYPEDNVDAGYLHAYTDELVARHTAESMQVMELFRRYTVSGAECITEKVSRRKFKVVEMVIPKGEKYWAGDSYDVAATALEWREDELVKE